MPRNFSPRKTPKRRGLARGTHREHREHPGHERPKPRLAVFFLGRRFVDVQVLLRRQFGRHFLIRRPQSRRHLVLDFHRQRRATRLTQQRAEEVGRPPLALTIEGHQHRRQRHQTRTGLPLRHADGQFRTCRLATAGTRQPMALVFGHMWLDLGQFPHLMPQRLRVAARELRATTSAFGRFEWLHVVALVGWNQRSFVFLVAGLPAAFLLRLAFRRLRPGVWMLRAGRQRGVLRRLLPAFKLRDPIEQRLHEGPNRRSHLGFKFRRIVMDSMFEDDMVHVVLENRVHVQINLPHKTPPGRERLQHAQRL